MPQRLLKAISTPTARSTAVYYFGNFGLSVVRYLFHLLLLRLLTPPEYGEFLSYLSLTYLLGVPMGTIGTLVTKKISDFNGKNDKKSINLFFYYLVRTFSPLAIIIGFLLVIFSTPLASIFKAHDIAFIVLGVSVLVSLYQTIIGSYLVAFEKLVFQTVVGLVGTVLTILLSILFIRVGMSATGAVLGQFLAGISVSAISLYYIKSYIHPKLSGQDKKSFSLKSLAGYSFIFALGTASLISTDVLMVRVLFNTHNSGIYSSLSILGRMILFGLTPISGIMLPIAANRFSATGNARTVLLKLGSVLAILGVIGAGIFSIIPNFVVRILSGSEYLEAAKYLPIYSFSMVFFAMSQLLLGYALAIGKQKTTILLLIVTVIQPILILVSRSSIAQVIWMNFGIHLALFVSLLIPTVVSHVNKRENQS